MRGGGAPLFGGGPAVAPLHPMAAGSPPVGPGQRAAMLSAPNQKADAANMYSNAAFTGNPIVLDKAGNQVIPVIEYVRRGHRDRSMVAKDGSFTQTQ